MTNAIVGKRVEIPTPATGPQTGSGRRGIAIAVVEIDSAVTGARVRYTRVDVRLDSGSLVSRDLRDLRIVS